MGSNARFRLVAIVLAFTTLLGLYSARYWGSPEKGGTSSETGSNFFMYYTAACLVRSHLSAEIYQVIDPNQNPQQLFADPNSVFAQTASSKGISRISLYLYPPTLADLVVPLTALKPAAALRAWNVLECLLIVGLSLILTRMLYVPSWGATVLIAAGVLFFRPTLNTIHWGQVSLLLAFLLTDGFALYASGRKLMAALLFALAIAIKLEPVVVIVPLIAWRDWKCIRSMAMWGVVLGLGLWAINGSAALNLYFLHQLPAMSNGTSGDVNRSVGNIFYTYLGAHSFFSRGLARLVRVVSALILCYAGWLSRVKRGETLTARRQFEMGILFLLFACCLSPYSWFYNWAVSAPAMVVFCWRSWEGKADVAETALLVAVLLSLSTSAFRMAMVTPLLGVALGLVALYRMRLERRPAERIVPSISRDDDYITGAVA